MLDALDAQVRAGDEDRWLASRFVADPARRRELVALYALNLELARTAAGVSQPLLGEMRFAWWSEGLDEVALGLSARSPLLEALREAARGGRLDRAALDALIEARHADLETEPFADEQALVRYLEATAGGLMAAAARLLGPAARPEAFAAAGRAWGWARWLETVRRGGESAARWRPAAWVAFSNEEVERHVAHQALAALAAARAHVPTLPVTAFPSVSYATLVPAMLQGREPGPLGKRLRLLRATLTGRL